MVRLFLSLALAFSLVGCASSSPSTPLNLSRSRPQVALIPVKNGTKANLPRDIEREMTDDLIDEFMKDGLIWMSPLNQFQTAWQQTASRDYFGADLSFANHFSCNDFLIISELIGHAVVPYNKREFPEIHVSHAPESQSVLSLAMRVRVIDLRAEAPTLVMQEVVESNTLLGVKSPFIDLSELSCSDPAYSETPVARGHRKLAEAVSARIREAIFCNW